MYVGSRKFWNEFKQKLQQRFSISCSVLEGLGSEISFLKRRLLRVEDGLALLPGSSIGKLIQVWEEKFGKLRSSTTPADSSIQMEDNSPCLVGNDVTFFRMAVGTCLYITRDRPDVAFTVKELSSYMSSPTISALRHLKKLVVYLKGTSNYVATQRADVTLFLAYFKKKLRAASSRSFLPVRLLPGSPRVSSPLALRRVWKLPVRKLLS